MRILAPSALWSAASTIRDEVTDLVLDIPATVDHVLGLIDRADELMTRAEALLARAEAMVVDGEELLARAAVTVEGSEETMIAVREVTRGAAVTTEAAGATAAGAAELVARTEALMAPLEPLADHATPMLSRFVTSISDAEVDAVVRMVDRLPRLLRHLEEDVLPMLGTLDRVGPDVHDILETVSELMNAVSGLPGASFLKRRGERKDEENDDDSSGDEHSPGVPGMPRL